jgi:hypothetical protein
VPDALDDPALDLDEAPSGLITRPTSWIAATRSTRTSPVSTSTATSATCTPNVITDIPVGFGPRPPLPRICAFVEQADDLLERPRAAVGADDVAALQRERRSSLS